MIYGKGTIVKFEPTPGGRTRAAHLIEEFPDSCTAVVKAPHHVELLVDFDLRPLIPEKAARRCRIEKFVTGLAAFLIFFALSTVTTCAVGLGVPSGAGFQEMTLRGVAPAPAAILGAGDADWPLFGKIVAIVLAVAALIPAWLLITGQKQTTHVKVEEPPAPKPPGNPRWATWDEVETLRKDFEGFRLETREQHEELTEKLDEKFAVLSKDRSVSVARLHDKIELTANGLRSEIDDKAKETRAEIHALPGCLIELLRNTGAIGGRKS